MVKKIAEFWQKEKMTESNLFSCCSFCGAAAIGFAVRLGDQKSIPFCENCLPAYNCASAVKRNFPWIDRILDLEGNTLVFL
jgi:hypothetical protein